jgi:flagellar secretion chaperone FliS
MSYKQAWQSYRQVSANTASPGQLVAMLYDGAINFLERALRGFSFDDPVEFNSTISNNVLRAQEIIAELNSSLDLTNGGELATTLRALYDYMDRRLTESNFNKTAEGIEDTVRRLTVLRDAWREMLGDSSRHTTSISAGLSACV